MKSLPLTSYLNLAMKMRKQLSREQLPSQRPCSNNLAPLLARVLHQVLNLNSNNNNSHPNSNHQVMEETRNQTMMIQVLPETKFNEREAKQGIISILAT
jgi:hypothetical protein